MTFMSINMVMVWVVQEGLFCVSSEYHFSWLSYKLGFTRTSVTVAGVKIELVKGSWDRMSKEMGFEQEALDSLGWFQSKIFVNRMVEGKTSHLCISEGWNTKGTVPWRRRRDTSVSSEPYAVLKEMPLVGINPVISFVEWLVLLAYMGTRTSD